MTVSARWLEPRDEPRWDEFVENHPLALVSQTSSWKRILELSFSHIRGRFLALCNDENRIVAGLPVYTVKSRILGNRVVCVPFGTLCDPLVSSGRELRQLLDALQESLGDLGCKRAELRTFRAADFVRETGLKAASHYKHHYLPLEQPLEALERSFHSTSVRQMIRKAHREGFAMQPGTTEDDLRVFYRLFVGTRRTLGLPPIPFRFFHHLWNELEPRGKAMLLLAQNRGKTVGAALLLRFNSICAVEFLGDIPEWRRMGVIQFVYWEAIKHALHHGDEVFSFGRTSSRNKGLLTFKKRWGTREEEITSFALPSCEYGDHRPVELSWQYQLVSAVCRHVPLPLNRLIGEACYRHMG